MTTLMTLRQAQYPSMDDARLAQQARADPEAFAEADNTRIRSALHTMKELGDLLRKNLRVL